MKNGYVRRVILLLLISATLLYAGAAAHPSAAQSQFQSQSQSQPQSQTAGPGVETQLWDPTQPVDILVHNPSGEPMTLPEPYDPPSLEEIYGPGVTEDDLLTRPPEGGNGTQAILVGPNVTLAVTYGDGPNEGFNDPTLGQDRRDAFEFAMQVWADLLQGPATITINATMTARGGSATQATLASAGPAAFYENFGNAPIADTYYAEAMVEIISGSDPNTNQLDIDVDFNSDVDNSTVLGNTDFYYGTDANPGTDIDFVTVSIHELAHGLGFSDSFQSDGSYGLGSQNHPVIYDRFLVNGSGQRLISLSTSSSNVTGNNVFWDGLLGRFAYNNDFGATGDVPIEAPTPFQAGSSIGHLEEATFTGDWDLETPNYDTPIHDPDSIVMGILQDIGYSLPRSRYADPDASGFEDGSSANPFDTAIEAVNDAPTGGFVRLFPGSYAETMTLDRAMQLRSSGGTAVIGE